MSIGTTVKRKTDKATFHVRGFNEGTGRWVLVPVVHGPLVQATPGELLRDYSGADPAAADAPVNAERDVIDRQMREAAESNRAYFGQGAKPRRKPLPGSPEAVFNGDDTPVERGPEGARGLALAILRDPERRGQWEIGVLPTHPAVELEIKRILEAADRA